MQTYLDNLLASMSEENKRLATCVTTLKSLVDEAKPAAPVVWPEPIAHMNVSRGGFIATLQDEGPYVFPVYSQAQVRAMLEAQGAKCG